MKIFSTLVGVVLLGEYGGNQCINLLINSKNSEKMYAVYFVMLYCCECPYLTC